MSGLGGYVLRRVPSALATLLLASVAVFLVLRLIPGDPAVSLAGSNPDPGSVHAIRHSLGLDEPLPRQYLTWLGHLATGNLGHSYVIGGDVGSLVAQRAGNTLELVLGALVVASALGLTLGVLGATVRRRAGRALLAAFNSVTLTVPGFVSGVVLMLVFAVWLRVLPVGGHASVLADPQIGVQYLVLPAVVLALTPAAVVSRYVKDGLRHALGEDYVRTARAAGVGPRRLLWRHALPNALPNVLTVAGLQVGALLGGAVVVERMFAWPGLGDLAEEGVTRRDYPVLQVLLILLVAVFVAVQLLTDVVLAWLDPRVRLG